MGSNSSKIDKFGRREFSDSENEHLFQILTRISGDGKQTFTQVQLEGYFHHIVSLNFVSRLVSYMKCATSKSTRDCQPKPTLAQTNEVNADEFLAAMVHALKGDSEETSCMLTFLASGNADSAKLQEFQQVYRELIKMCLLTAPSGDAWKNNAHSTELFVKYILHDLVYTDGRQQCDVTQPLPLQQTFSVSNVERWLMTSACAQYIFRSAFQACFPTDDFTRLPSIIPVCKVPPRARFDTSAILDLPTIAFLDRCLPHELRGTWRPLFSSSKQGESFQSLVRTILNQGPTVLIIQDHDGYIFGGFAAVSWTYSSNFYGSPYCFLFSLAPVMDVYFQSGLNTNYMYLNQNQQTLPNGLGMGGQFGYCGLWLEHEYGVGHSLAQPKCTTYNSPQLSGKPRFSIQMLEVWAVGPELGKTADDVGTEEDDVKTKPKTILDKDSGAKTMLEMIGKSNLSDAIRDADTRVQPQ